MVLFGTFDVAQLALYIFWGFFIGLVIYLQRENMREGYPLISEATGKPINAGPFPLPDPKTFKLPHGGGDMTVPTDNGDKRAVAAKPTAPWVGAPLEPTGNPMVDGVGPSAWAERKDEPDLTYEGQPKMVPMRLLNDFSIAEGDSDIRGWTVRGCDGVVAGTVKDIWIDKSEHLIRYLEVELANGINTRLLPMTQAYVTRFSREVEVSAIKAQQFAQVPTLKNPDRVTFLEEDKIMAYYAGGRLFADPKRREALL